MGDNDPEYENDTDERTESGESDTEEPSNEKLTLKARKVRRSNGKWKLYYDTRIFKKEWEEAFPWCEADPEDPKFAICRACNKKIKAHKGILETHQKTKRHIRNLSGSDDLDDENERERKTEPKMTSATSMPPGMEQMVGDDQISFFTESPVDAAHQAMTSLIDKLVERYHERKLDNLKAQNDAMLQLHRERIELLNRENQNKSENRLQQEAYKREAQEAHLRFMQMQHDTKISAMEDERDAKLRAVEQELMFARQEYEKKMKLLDVQLSCMK